MKKTVKVILLCIIAAAGIGGGIYFAAKPMELVTTVVSPKTAELTFTEQGIVLSVRYVEVFATIPGRIYMISAEEGQYVNQGDILCRIDAGRREDELLRAREREESTRMLFDAGFLPRQDLINIENTVRDLERILSDTVIRAPVSGTVFMLNIKDTNVVSAQIPIAVIAADRECAVETFVAIKDMSVIENGKSVVMILEGRYEDTVINGKVISVDDHALVQISVLGIEERKVKVTIAPDDCVQLKDGYEVDVRFSYYYEENKLTVPKTAVFKEDGIERVWRIMNGRAEKVQVLRGMELRIEFVIESGLLQGDIVVVDSNVKGLKDGIRVKFY